MSQEVGLDQIIACADIVQTIFFFFKSKVNRGNAGQFSVCKSCSFTGPESLQAHMHALRRIHLPTDVLSRISPLLCIQLDNMKNPEGWTLAKKQQSQ